MIKSSLYQLKLVASICCCLFITMLANAQPNKIIGYVNQQPVENAALEREIETQKSEVMNELSQQYHLTDLSNFWSRKFDGVKASDILKKKAWDALIKAKVQEQLFNSLNLWPFKNSAELNTEMEKVNAEREKLKTAGKVIYGPVLFTQKSFYNYEFSNAIIKTKDKIFPRPIAETTLLEHYKKLKKTIYANADYDFEEVKSHIETSFIDEAYEKLVTSKIMQATVTIKNYTTNK